ncbi:hypothetical protein FHL15_002585 [Xylaria flabelliformis]|uniref:F-box domain-containing protein n=1 Tax=Xylaria flabelliformis TaxID=2512241 RepID=A0A553I801_9PEZI|nr:hypothetical protein FHL15_002585 [Xylaria flabelliformis]
MEPLKRALHLPHVVKFPWHQSCSKAYLLQLPIELIHLINSFLTPVDLALLSLTCRSLRIILKDYTNTAQLSHDERGSYLYYRARALPKVWACWDCKKFHPILKYDVPACFNERSSCRIACQRGEGRMWADGMDNRNFNNQIRFSHRHIQLALKYTRLQQRKYNSYLQALLAPHHNLWFGGSREIPLKTHYSVYPKLVAGHDGNLRFMTLSTWRYYTEGRDISYWEIGYQQICPHLHMNVHGLQFGRHGPWVILENAFLRTLKGRGDGTGSCGRCGMDFRARLGPSYLEFHVWQDFGPEGPPINYGHFSWPAYSEMKKMDCDHPETPHEPGTIRKLYELEAPEEEHRLSITAFPRISSMRRAWRNWNPTLDIWKAYQECEEWWEAQQEKRWERRRQRNAPPLQESGGEW